MKVNVINANYPVRKNYSLKNVSEPAEIQTKKPALITFRSGNPKHIAHIVAEEPLFGMAGGGVGTVSHDYNFLDKDVEKITKIIPLYNQEVTYKKDVDSLGKVRGELPQGIKVRYIPDNLPEGHPFKGKEGTPFITKATIGTNADLAAILEKEKNNVFLLDEIASSKMDWGFEKDVPIKMFKARKDGALAKAMDNKGMSKELQNKLEFVFTYVDSVSSMTKPYDDGCSYSTASGTDLEKRFASGWQGQPYVKNNKAIVELLPELKAKAGIDPKYLLCSDGQSMFTMHYAAMKNAAGNSYWQDKFLGGVGHNMGQGYIQEMGARQAIVNLGATKEDIEKIINSEKYIEALKLGREEDFLRETILKNFYSEKSGMSAFSVPIHYAKAGYVPMLTTVSEGYADSVISNELVSPLYADLVELNKMGRFKGITNPLNDPTVTGFKYDGLQKSFKTDSKLKLADGKEVTVPKFQIFDINKKYDLSHIREIKRQNKINLFDRFSSKYRNSQYFDSAKNKYEAAGSGFEHIIAGQAGRKIDVYGEISGDFIKKLEAGKDVKLVTSWGRVDFQKGLDTVLDAFEKYAAKDPDAVLIAGGQVNTNNPESVAVLDKYSKMLKPELKGRVVFINGWTPGKDLAHAADVAILPSRFAPCELTDLEAGKYLCTPIVPNVQGMAQKNFDPSVASEAEKMNAYKGKHEFYMTEEEALKSANETEKQAFEKVKKNLEKEISNKYKQHIGEDIPADYLKDRLMYEAEYLKALRKLKDSVISDEMSECLERALITDRNGKNAETILKNQVNMNTTWFGNGWLSKTGKSAGELYSEYHFNNNNGKNISDGDLIKLDYSDLGEAAKGKSSGGFRTWIKSKGGKWTIGIAAALAAAGAGYAIFKNNQKNKQVEEVNEIEDIKDINNEPESINETSETNETKIVDIYDEDEENGASINTVA